MDEAKAKITGLARQILRIRAAQRALLHAFGVDTSVVWTQEQQLAAERVHYEIHEMVRGTVAGELPESTPSFLFFDPAVHRDPPVTPGG